MRPRFGQEIGGLGFSFGFAFSEELIDVLLGHDVFGNVTVLGEIFRGYCFVEFAGGVLPVQVLVQDF